ncbi:MAG: hypothetical protein EOO20_03695 [Chryseobacterium sp.]|nr:MAG: hypothetical protein EOO20_03695 [Chryseobacterium sp.]
MVMEENIALVKNVNFELDQYLQSLFHEVQSRVYADGTGVFKEDKFTEYMMEQLEEAGETEGMVVCNYVKPNERGNVEFKINGYAIHENYETLDLFITHYRDTAGLYNLKKTEFEDAVKFITRFANACIKGYLDEIDPSHTAWGLARVISENHREFDRINIFVLSNGSIGHEPPLNFRLKGLDDLRIIFHVWDAERFYRLSQSRDNREPIQITFSDIYHEGVPCLKMPVKNDVYECYLAIVPGKILSILYDNYSTRLLESNVRAFLQQNGTTNKGIRDTIRGDKPYMFLPYNNGLAVTAAEVTTELVDGQLLLTRINDFQIVNGGQTTASLFHTQKKYKLSLSEIYVQMKLTVIRDHDLKNHEVPNISRFSNTQNRVSDLDHSSNHPFLQRIEQLSRTTYASHPGDHNKQTIWFFERVKGQYRELFNKESTKTRQDAFKIKYPLNQKFVKSEMGKYLNTWRQLPYFVSLGAEKNYPKFMLSVEKDFSKKMPGRLYFRDLVATGILFKKAEELFGRKGKEPVGDTNIRSFVVTYSLSLLSYLTESRIDLGKIWDLQDVPDGLQQEILGLLRFVYNYLDSSKESLVSEFARKKSTWDDLLLSNYNLNMANLEGLVLSPQEYISVYSEETDRALEAEHYRQTERITGMGLAFWDGLSIWLLQRGDFTEVQKNFVVNIRSKLFRMGILSETEIKKGLEILVQLESLDIPEGFITGLSKHAEEVPVNTSEIFSRISAVSASDWQKVIELGQQTNTVSFNEVSILRTVIRMLGKGEQIDLKRLSIVNDCLDRLRKYGLKH